MLWFLRISDGMNKQDSTAVFVYKLNNQKHVGYVNYKVMFKTRAATWTDSVFYLY